MMNAAGTSIDQPQSELGQHQHQAQHQHRPHQPHQPHQPQQSPSPVVQSSSSFHRSPYSASGSQSPAGSGSGEPPKKKRRRRRSAITGTLFYPGEEPDPDAGLEKLPDDDERKKPKGLEKRFPCDWPGCEKVFSRPDHLSRHRLNHEPEKIYTCDRCSKIFVRSDLLTRHSERHDRREMAQAAGTTLAAMNNHLNRATTTILTPGTLSRANTSAHLSNLVLPNTDSPISPHAPTPFGGAGFVVPDPGLAASPAFSQSFTTPASNDDPSGLRSTATADFGTASTANLDFHSTGVSNPPDGSIGPGSVSNLPGFFGGTAMSLDAPFFSGQDFQWLFDGSMGEGWPESMSWSRLGSPAPRNTLNNNLYFQEPQQHASANLVLPMQGPSALVDPTLQQSQYGRPQPTTTIFSRSPASGSGASAAGQSPLDQQSRTTSQPQVPSTSLSSSLTKASEPQVPQKRPLEDESVLVSEETRMKIIATVKELPELERDPRFTTEALGRYLQLYWANVHDSSFPILHRPTFKTREAFVPLLCSMICLGGYFTDTDGHELASALHEDIRKQMISSSEFRPRASLGMIQTTLLSILYGKLCSTRYHHEMAHIFWGSNLTMYRRSALFSPRGSHPPHELRNDPEAQWRAWIQDETAKRAAYTAFLIDVQHAAIFRHAPTLSAFQVQHVLPADEEEWTAPTASEWQKAHAQARPGAPFMSALKASLMPGLAPPFLNPFSRVVILHGLISVAFDMQWRDVFMLGLAAPDGPVKDWRETISAAFNAWKSRLDSCLMSSSAPAHQLLRASISLYALAHIVLSIDVHELQIFAGAQKALGLVVAQHVIESTRDRVYKWAVSKDGRASTWHAAHFLRSSLLHLNQSNDLLHCLHYTWACYISVLTVFAYGRALSGPPPPYEPSTNVRSVEAAMGYLDAMCTQSPDSLPMVATKHHSLPLIAAIFDVIKGSRWEIALEGSRILLRLLRSASI